MVFGSKRPPHKVYAGMFIDVKRGRLFTVKSTVVLWSTGMFKLVKRGILLSLMDPALIRAG
jgi:hypothetical protein